MITKNKHQFKKKIQEHWIIVKGHEKILFAKNQEEKAKKNQEDGSQPQDPKHVTKKSTNNIEADKLILPHILIIGKNLHESLCHVTVADDIYYSFNNITMAVDVSFKLIYGLHHLWSYKRLATSYGRDVPHLWQLVQYITGAKCAEMGSQYSCQSKILNAIDPNREIFVELGSQAIETIQNNV